ncbi:hypothetical protein SAMCFNEI73_pC0552 (plasmid) [Sinorhizobium americanum]|uniref:Uncharacterized protein n=1 Tax=Sinorhizobium americanum TaxID=194963 RepID=A0A1L3LW72_9HYPH|nr:hypothetical protein SAMCFNEI73_pC0552 [Sinorhizobium americanum]
MKLGEGAGTSGQRGTRRYPLWPAGYLPHKGGDELRQAAQFQWRG